MSADLRERVARAMCRATEGHERYWVGFLQSADAVLAELAPELAPQPYHWDGVNPPVPIAQQPQASAEVQRDGDEEIRAAYAEKRREQWAEMTAEVRAHEAGE